MLSPGHRLGQYEVVSPLGAGGMGEVYRAHDTRLGRDVALKVLPSGSLADENARRRFRKEALALSRLSHPHIASLFDFDTSGDGTDFLAMELVPGPSLDARLKRGPLPEKDVVRLGTQLLRALVAAHEHGVLHRDLKPQNLKLTADGLVKVLDFGLARIAPAPGDGETTDTAGGSVAGTPPYMSPEQLLGKEVDARADVYAAGVVLFELATGRRPFGEASGPSLVAKILNEATPPPRELNPEVSPVLEQVILKATDRDKELRHQSAKDLLVDLERLAAGTRPVEVRRKRSVGRSSWIAVGLAVLAIVVASVAWLTRTRELRIASVRTLVEGKHVNGLATDGASVYYAEEHLVTDRIMTVPLASGVPREIPLPWRGESQVVVLGLRRAPPELLLCRNGDLWRLPLPGGVPIPMPVRPRGCLAAWSAGGDRLAWVEEGSVGDVLLAGNAEGGGRRVVAGAGEGVSLQPLGWAPRGDRIRFVRSDRPTAWLDVPATGGTPREVLEAFPPGLTNEVSGWPGWTADGRYFLCPSRTALFAFPERADGRLSDPRILVAPSPLRRMSPTSDGRRLVGFVDRPGSSIVRLDPATGAITPLVGGAPASVARYSPDGTQVAWVSTPRFFGRLFSSRPDGSERVQVSDLMLDGILPVQWSPDGRQIAFTGWDQPQGTRHRLYLATLGTGRVELLAPEDPTRGQADPCWSPDGKWLAYGPSLLGGFPPDEDLYLRRVDLATRAVTRLPGSEGLFGPRCAPDGRILAHDHFAQRDAAGRLGAGDEPGRVFFRVRDPKTGTWSPLSVEVPSAGGAASNWPGGHLTYPTWSRDGRHVYAYLASTASVVRFDLRSRRVETVTNVAGLEGEFSSWMDLDPTDAPLVHRDTSVREIVVMDLETR